MAGRYRQGLVVHHLTKGPADSLLGQKNHHLVVIKVEKITAKFCKFWQSYVKWHVEREASSSVYINFGISLEKYQINILTNLVEIPAITTNLKGPKNTFSTRPWNEVAVFTKLLILFWVPNHCYIGHYSQYQPYPILYYHCSNCPLKSIMLLKSL